MNLTSLNQFEKQLEIFQLVVVECMSRQMCRHSIEFEKSLIELSEKILEADKALQVVKAELQADSNRKIDR